MSNELQRLAGAFGAKNNKSKNFKPNANFEKAKNYQKQEMDDLKARVKALEDTILVMLDMMSSIAEQINPTPATSEEDV